MTRRTEKGFTLIELMITVAIIAIIAAIAYPSYLNQVRDSRRSDGESALMEMMSAQERYYTDNSAYTTDLTNVGYAASSDVATEGGWYKIKATSCGAGINSCVQLTATGQNDQANDSGCTPLTLDSRGTKGPAGCW